MIMKKYVYAAGTFALALAMSALPSAAFAEGGDEGQGNAGVQMTAQTQGIQAQTDSSVGRGEGERSSGDRQRQQEVKRGESGHQFEATSSDNQSGNEEMSNDQNTQGVGEDQGEIHLDLESEGNPATSFEDLKRKIEARKHELEQEVASTTPADRSIVENANPVRLAVRSFLSSKNLLGGIGPEVSQIAKEVNDSVATTTSAEAQIQARGFFTRLLFGGDSAAADVISQEVAQNQERIDTLTKLLGAANVPADIKATLQAQITAIQDAQTRLEDLAQKEQTAWGLFSWRF
ncbi:MAG: hypothetical protein KGH56_03050 [Patescibacteria group bacterium]|nr:hypothetical protein [Patescibacteria group bacterium]